MKTVLLLLASNIFMTFAWYGQLKAIQEIVTLAVFVVFSLLYLKEAFRRNYAASFGCMVAAVYFAFRF